MKFAIAILLAAQAAASWGGVNYGRSYDLGARRADSRYARTSYGGKGGKSYASSSAGQSRRGSYGSGGYGGIGYGTSGYGGKSYGGKSYGVQKHGGYGDKHYSHGGYVQGYSHDYGRGYTTNWSSAGYGDKNKHGYGYEPYAHGSETVIYQDYEKSSPYSHRSKGKTRRYGYKKSGTIDFKGLSGLNGLGGLGGLNGTGMSL